MKSFHRSEVKGKFQRCNMHARTHPGEMLKKEFILAMRISKGELAEAICVHEPVIPDLLEQRHRINAEMAT